MASKLEDIRPRRVSLVKRGANLRRILLAKSDEENLDGFVATLLAAPVEKEDELLAAVEASQGDESVQKAMATAIRAVDALREPYGDEFRDLFVKAAKQQMLDQDADDDNDADGDKDEDEDGDEDDVAKAFEEVVKDDFSAEERQEMAKNGQALPDGSYPIPNREYLERAVHAVGRGKNNSHTRIRSHIAKRAKALGATSMLPDNWNVTKEDSMSETAQAVPVKKEDGSWDLSAVPEESREAFEAILKAQEDEVADLRKEKEESDSKADEAILIAKAERDARERRDYIAKASEYANLSKSDEEIGDLLLSIAKAERDDQLPEGTTEKLDELLKAANEAAAPVFKEAGRAGRFGGEGSEKIDAAAAELRKAESGLTKEKAIAKALENDPTLYDEYRRSI